MVAPLGKLLPTSIDLSDSATKMSRRAYFMGLTQSPSERISAWSARVATEASQCTSIGIKLDDDDKTTVFLKGLTPAYHRARMSNLLASIALHKTTLTFTSVKAVLLATESVDAASFENQASPSAFKAEAPRPNRPRQPSGIRSDMCN